MSANSDRPQPTSTARPPARRDVLLEQGPQSAHLVLVQLGQKRVVGCTAVPVGGVLADVEGAENVAVNEFQKHRLDAADASIAVPHDELEVAQRVERVLGVMPLVGRRDRRAVDR